MSPERKYLLNPKFFGSTMLARSQTSICKRGFGPGQEGLVISTAMIHVLLREIAYLISDAD